VIKDWKGANRKHMRGSDRWGKWARKHYW